MIKMFLNWLLNRKDKYNFLENKVSQLKKENTLKSKKLKEDINNLYKITTSLNTNSDKDLNYFMYRNNLSSICIFDTDGNLINYNTEAQNFFNKKHNLMLNISDIHLRNILKVLNISETNSIVLKTLKTKKRNFIAYNDIYISTIPIFEENTLTKIILQIKENTNDFILQEKQLNVDFEYINFIYYDGKNNISPTYENDFKETISFNKNILEFIHKLKKIIHEDDFDEIYNDIMSVIFSNISTNININCRVKTNNRNEYAHFYGNLLILSLDNNLYSLVNNIKFTVKLVGFLIDEQVNKKIKNIDEFKLSMNVLNNLQYSLRLGVEYNIKEIKYFLQNIFQFDDLIYIKQKENNLFENKILFSDDIDKQLKNELEKFIFDYLDGKIIKDKSNIYKLGDIYLYINEITFHNDLSNFFILTSKYKTKLNVINNKKLFLDIFSTYIRKEENSKICNEIFNVFYSIVNLLDEWIWIKDYNNNILFINDKMINDIFKDFLEKNSKWRFIIKNNNTLKQLPEDVYKLLLTNTDSREVLINKNNKEYKIKLKTFEYKSYSTNLIFSIGKIK